MDARVVSLKRWTFSPATIQLLSAPVVLSWPGSKGAKALRAGQRGGQAVFRLHCIGRWRCTPAVEVLDSIPSRIFASDLGRWKPPELKAELARTRSEAWPANRPDKKTRTRKLTTAARDRGSQS